MTIRKNRLVIGLQKFLCWQSQTSIIIRSPNHLHLDHLLSSSMENQHQKQEYVHYNHNDPCRYERWTARESYQFMYARRWQLVNDFYLNVVQGSLSLPALFETATLIDQNDTEIPALSDKTVLESSASEDRCGRWARITFKIILSYHGGSFDGWQKQPGLKTVQSIVEGSLGEFVDERKAQLLKEKGLPIEGCAAVAGRTDKGVTAFQQVCSFYSWRKDVKLRDIEDAINQAAPGKLRVISVSEVSRGFHPNFSAKWRRYLYIFPLTNGEYGDQSRGDGGFCENVKYNEIHDSINKDGVESEKKSFEFSVRKVNQLLRKLEGKLLSFKMFARDTKASRNE